MKHTHFFFSAEQNALGGCCTPTEPDRKREREGVVARETGAARRSFSLAMSSAQGGGSAEVHIPTVSWTASQAVKKTDSSRTVAVGETRRRLTAKAFLASHRSAARLKAKALSVTQPPPSRVGVRDSNRL